jgi:AmmeMemoRadiSam system protein B
MGIPSKGTDLRGQQDAVGFASTAEQMAKVWELSLAAPPPEKLGEAPKPGVIGIICPHDDYLYAGRVYRQIVPLVTARTVVLVGVFHGYRKFGAHDVLVFDPYRAWRTPDGEVPVSPVREELLAQLPKSDFVQDAAMHDSEHSLEAIAFWLRHIRPDLEIVPVIVPAMSFPRMSELADHLAQALSVTLQKRSWKLGRDLAIVISTDGVHYGPDFNQTQFGEGGVDSYVKACEQDRALIRGPLAGAISRDKVQGLFSTFVDPERPDQYRLTWCGRFSVPFGLLLLDSVARRSKVPAPIGHPVVYATSVGWPELPVRSIGMNATAPANLYHFVGYPAVAFTSSE